MTGAYVFIAHWKQVCLSKVENLQKSRVIVHQTSSLKWVLKFSLYKILFCIKKAFGVYWMKPGHPQKLTLCTTSDISDKKKTGSKVH